MKYLGIDVGGTNIKYGIFDEFGSEDILKSGEIKTVTNNLELFLESIDDIVSKFDVIDGIGLSIPCAVNSKMGIVVEPGGVPVLNGLNIKEVLNTRLGIKVAVENDANCCALAEKWIGNGKDSESFICITIGTGIGGGIIINNKLLTGKQCFAGEFGKMLFDINEKDIKNCKCASYYGATSSLVRNVAKELNMNKQELNGRMIFEMIEKGNESVIKVYNEWISRLSVIIANLGFLFDPDKILIGGGVSGATKVIDDVRAKIKNIDVYGMEWEINSCKYFNNSGKIGAVYNYIIENS